MDYPEGDWYGNGESYDSALEEIRAAYGERYERYRHDANGYGEIYDYYDSEGFDMESLSAVNFGSSSGDESEPSDEEIQRFILTAQSGDHDADIANDLKSLSGRAADCAGHRNSHDRAYPPQLLALGEREFYRHRWEERTAIAVENLKHQLQELSSNFISPILQSVDVDIGSLNPSLVLRSDSRRSRHGEKHYREPIVPHDPSLVPYWNQLASAISQHDGVHFNCFSIVIENVQLTNEVFATLAKGFSGKFPSMNMMRLQETFLCGKGIVSLSDLVRGGLPSLSQLHLCRNPINDLRATSQLSRALKAHPGLKSLMITQCNVGNNADILSALLQSDAEAIYLDDNGIGSSGARRVAQHLKTNPTIHLLSLVGNNFNDDDAILFAGALRKNTNLKDFDLSSNDFTSAGVKSLLTGIFDPSSLNAISDSNHTCRIRLYRTSERDPPTMLKLFRTNEVLNRRRKILVAVHGNGSLLEYLADVPPELIPDVVRWLQVSVDDQNRQVNMIYTIMRWWNMPLLYEYYRAPRDSKRKEETIE